MPITVEIVDSKVTEKDFQAIYNIFDEADRIFSTFRDDSEISRINSGKTKLSEASPQMKEVLKLAEETNKETSGYFDIKRPGGLDPLGIVKGWMINEAAKELRRRGFKNFFIEVAGDIQAVGFNAEGKVWQVGICNPFKRDEIVKIIALFNAGIATSGTYERGKHIYNPKDDFKETSEIASISIIGPNIYEADRFATAAFAMGSSGIRFVKDKAKLEGYMIDNNGVATLTSGWKNYEIN